MTYLVLGKTNCSLVRKWVSALNDPLVYTEDSKLFNTFGTAWQISVTASGSNESVLLLKYGNMIEQVS